MKYTFEIHIGTKYGKKSHNTLKKKIHSVLLPVKNEEKDKPVFPGLVVVPFCPDKH